MPIEDITMLRESFMTKPTDNTPVKINDHTYQVGWFRVDIKENVVRDDKGETVDLPALKEMILDKVREII
jgi:hypothetical protein